MAFGNNKPGYSLVILCMIVVGSVMLSNNMQGVLAQCPGSSIDDLMKQCQQFVVKPGPQIPPSQDCCKVVKGADVPCICNTIPGGLEAFISMEKVLYVARTCGLSIPPGFKCGSYTAPPTPNP